jgi:hypothetical protein
MKEKSADGQQALYCGFHCHLGTEYVLGLKSRELPKPRRSGAAAGDGTLNGAGASILPTSQLRCRSAKQVFL